MTKEEYYLNELARLHMNLAAAAQRLEEVEKQLAQKLASEESGQPEKKGESA